MVTRKKIRTRIAPSPTGALHIGTAHTALFNYLFTKHNKGIFILRIEDTDKERSKKRFEKDITQGLKWLGITWDEGPYYQSKRTAIYKKYLKKMLKQGNAFYCWHAKDELQKEQARQAENKQAQRHICEYRNEKITNGEKIARSIIRFKNEKQGSIAFEDMVKGRIVFNPTLLGDFSIAKNIKEALYNFAVVADDAEMNITHIIRGEDHISNTPKQLLLQMALGKPRPQYAHIPLILGPDRSKLSKRHGASSITDYAEMGYLAPAMVNFLALLGWRAPNDEMEILSNKELVHNFELSDVQTSPAIFDIEKLNWINAQYIRNTKLAELTQYARPYLQNAEFINKKTNTKWLQKVVALEHKRIQKLSEITEATEFIFTNIQYDAALLLWRGMSEMELKSILEKLTSLLSEVPQNKWNTKYLNKLIMPPAEALGDRGKMLWPLRVALSGRKASPGPFEILDVLGKEKSLARIQKALAMLQ